MRSTGAGVRFNWERILTAVGMLFAAAMLKRYFHGDYATIGIYTSFIYAAGLIIVFFIPRRVPTTLDD